MKKQTERLGVASLEKFFSKVGWLFREQLVHDYGIDAQVEIVDNSYPTGELIAIQIKSGHSYFSEESEDAYIYRTQDKHISYWRNHSLPVILVLYHPDLDNLFWQIVNAETVISTGGNWKISIPKDHILSEDSIPVLRDLTQPEPYIRKLNKLKLDKPWMLKLKEGYEVFLNFSDWVNKSLPRYRLTISCEGEEYVWPMAYGPGVSIKEILKYYIPWASFHLDIDTHKAEAENTWFDECYMGYDKEDGEYFFSEPFESWYKAPDEIVPVSSDGECDHYSIILSLNKLGSSFLYLDEYLSQENQIRLFTF